MRKILITGSNGFTGRFVCKQLIKNGVAFHKLESNLNNKKSLLKEIQSVKPYKILHLAGTAVTESGELDKKYKNNLIGSINLFESIKESNYKIEKLFIASTGSIYDIKKSEKVNEKSNLLPKNHYGFTKYFVEQISKMYDFPIIILRPFNYTGVGQTEDFLIPKIISHFKNCKEEIQLGNVEIEREFNDVRFVAKVYSELLLKFDHQYRVINICSGNAVSIKSIITICEDLYGYKIKVKKNNLFVRNEPKRIVGNPQRLEKIIGNLNEYNIEDTLKWMKTNQS